MKSDNSRVKSLSLSALNVCSVLLATAILLEVAIRILALANELSVPLIDGLTPLQQRGTVDSLYWKIDGHLNPLGYQLLAQVIFEDLSKMMPTRAIPERS